MKKISKIILLSFAIGCLSVHAIGFSDWILNDNNSKQYEITPNSKEAVCKINNTYYTSIGKAIEESKTNDTIEVIPGNADRKNDINYTIDTNKQNKTLIIPQGVTLSIPYELGKANNKVAKGVSGVNALSKRSEYCKSSVILGDGVKLINNGVIEIGGIIGAAGGGAPTGCTGGNYSEFILGNGSVLENHNTINLYGFLGEKEDGKSQLILKPNLENVNPSLNMPMYWHDFGGGSALKAIYDSMGTKFCMPLDDFYFENNTVATRIYGGSEVIAWANLYAAKANGQYDMKLIGKSNDSIINLPNGSYLESNYNEKTLINNLHFYGDTVFNALTIDLEQAIKNTAGIFAWGIASAAGVPSQVSSTSGYFPVSYHFDITLDKLAEKNNAYFNGLSNRYKFLNGSKLKINKDVKLEVKEIVAYKGDDIYSARAGHAANLLKSNTPLIPADMIINGTLKADIIAGTFSASDIGGEITATTNSSITMYEPKNGEGSKGSAYMYEGEQGWFYIPLILKLKDSSGNIADRNPGTFNCVGDNQYYWKQMKELINVVIEEIDGNYSSGKKQAATFNIKAKFIPEDYTDEIESFEWKQNRHRTNVSYDGTFENSTAFETTFKTVENANLFYDNKIDVWLEIKVKGKEQIFKTNVLTFTARK